jgi:starch phosphorylase
MVLAALIGLSLGLLGSGGSIITLPVLVYLALNGVPSLSILDGWWIEGCIEGVTGWAMGERGDLTPKPGDRADCDAASLYDKLEHVVLPLFYQQRERFVDVMRHAIALNGSSFNAQRMLLQYVLKALFRVNAGR